MTTDWPVVKPDVSGRAPLYKHQLQEDQNAVTLQTFFGVVVSRLRSNSKSHIVQRKALEFCDLIEGTLLRLYPCYKLTKEKILKSKSTYSLIKNLASLDFMPDNIKMYKSNPRTVRFCEWRAYVRCEAAAPQKRQ